MRYLIGIPYVTGREFTLRALKSLGRHVENAVVCDCSEPPYERAPHNSDCFASAAERWEVDRPIVPYNFTQTMNYFQELAKRREADVLLYMHNDAEASPNVVEELLTRAFDLAGKKWGVLFTAYDALAAFNVKMFDDVGPWDARLFPFPYYSDNDYYHRVRLKGWTMADTGLPVAHHGSHSLKLSPRYKFLNQVTFEVQRDLFVKKWGADPNVGFDGLWKEPFDGKLPEL